jgi:uncharacterized protein (TIGR02145 family)
MRFITQQGRVLLLTAVLVVGSVCVSYGDNPSALVGPWVSMKNGRNVELFKDGIGVTGNSSITWKTEGKRFVYTEGTFTSIGDYNLSGYELTRTFDDGEVIVWVRKDKLKEYVEKNTIYFTDSRNGQNYRAVKIGGKMWMAQNLNYQTGNSWCYENNNSNCEKYGRLYDWNTARTVCPAGWHLSSREEWNGLVAASGVDVAGKTLKSASGWDNNGNGFDGNGFSALPGGRRSPAGSFLNVGKNGCWWTVTENGSGYTYGRYMHYEGGGVGEYDYDRGNGFSVRCLQDN